MKTLLFVVLMLIMLAQKTIKVRIAFMENQGNILINTGKMKVNEHALVLIKNRLHN